MPKENLDTMIGGWVLSYTPINFDLHFISNLLVSATYNLELSFSQ